MNLISTLVIKAPAKINLAIDILSKREDGYHYVDMVTIPLKLHDSVEITPDKKIQSTYLFCSDPTIICDESNLAYKALDVMKNNFSIPGNYRIFIYKKIPVEAGLGGGSADAAAVMRALVHFIPNMINEKDKIIDLAKGIGADVPFCLLNKPCRVGGIGEKMEPIEVKIPYSVLIVKPKIGLATKTVYEAYDLITEEIKHPNIPALIQALKEGDEKIIEENLINVLTVPAIKALPLVGEILDKLKKLSLPLCGMSGTGSACFALSRDKKYLEKVANIFEKEGYQTIVTEFANY